MMADADQLFPDGIGEVLQALLSPEPQPGPPYTHTFSYPPTEYDKDDEPLPQPIQPTMTVTRIIQEVVPPPESSLHPLLLDHGIDRTVADSHD
jgi:hypothetical protein